VNAKDAVRLAYRHAAVALHSYRDHHLDDELAAEPALSEADRALLDEQLDDLQHYLEAIAGTADPALLLAQGAPPSAVKWQRGDLAGVVLQADADDPPPAGSTWVATAVAMEARRARDARADPDPARHASSDGEDVGDPFEITGHPYASTEVCRVCGQRRSAHAPEAAATLQPAGLAGVPVTDWMADALTEAMAGPDLNGAPDTGYCAPAIGVHVEPHRGCVMR
jgi:hypothetical protein